MKKLLEKFTALLLAATMTFALPLSGCTSTDNTGSNSGAKEAQIDSTDESDSGEVTTIRFINGFTGGDGPFMDKIVDGFNESQDKYYIEQVQDSDYYARFRSEDFDMLVMHADWISTYHTLGLLREVSDIYEAADISFEDDFHPITKTYTKYDNGIFAFPLDLYAETFYYNTEYVKEAPTTYEDMTALKEELNSEETGIYPLVFSLSGDHQWAWMTALGQSGVEWVKGQSIKLDTKDVCNAFLKIHDLIYVDKLAAVSTQENDHFNTFINDSSNNINSITATCSLTGPWSLTSAKEALGDNLGIATIPQLYGDTVCVPAGGHAFAVSSKVNNQKKLDGIAAFMAYAYQPEVMLNWADSGQAPIHLETMELVKQSPDKYPVANVNYKVFNDAMILPAIYNIREQVKYVNETIWPLIIQTEDLSYDDLMKELREATRLAEKLSQY